MRVPLALAVLAAASTFVYVNAQSGVEAEVAKADEQCAASITFACGRSNCRGASSTSPPFGRLIRPPCRNY
jgi:hypothetical protein